MNNIIYILNKNADLVDYISANSADELYKFHRIKKKRKGKYRLICSPREDLKHVQRLLSKVLNLTVHNAAAGFIPNRGVIHNVLSHAGSNHVLNVDIKNYFQSINGTIVHNVLCKNGYSSVVDSLIKLVTYNYSLPTGAPSSPLLSNAVCYEMDVELEQYARDNMLVYTRYVDDITLSSQSFIPGAVLTSVTAIIQKHGFILNDNKTRYASQQRSMNVTGLVINEDKSCHNFAPRIPRKRMRIIRAMIHRQHADSSFSDQPALFPCRPSPRESLCRSIKGYHAWTKSINSIQASRIQKWMEDFATKYKSADKRADDEDVPF